jgi:hypothetical protein
MKTINNNNLEKAINLIAKKILGDKKYRVAYNSIGYNYKSCFNVVSRDRNKINAFNDAMNRLFNEYNIV